MTSTLVCIMAQVRLGDPTWLKFKEHVLDVFAADLALCISDAPPKAFGKFTGEPISEGPFFKNAKYIFKMKEPDDWLQALETMSPELVHFRHFPGHWRVPGGINTYFKWFLYKNLEQNNLLSKYDRIIITRSDYFWQSPHPVLDNEHVWVPEGECHGGICDRHMVIPSKWAKEFLAVGERLRVDKHMMPMIELLKKRPWGRNFMMNNETFLWFMYLSEGLHERIGFFKHVMYVLTIKYPDEFVDAMNPSQNIVTWPWTIDHTYVSPVSTMFRGRLNK